MWQSHLHTNVTWCHAILPGNLPQGSIWTDHKVQSQLLHAILASNLWTVSRSNKISLKYSRCDTAFLEVCTPSLGTRLPRIPEHISPQLKLCIKCSFGRPRNNGCCAHLTVFMPLSQSSEIQHHRIGGGVFFSFWITPKTRLQTTCCRKKKHQIR